MANFTGTELEDLPDDSFFLGYTAAVVFFSILACVFCCCCSPVPVGAGVFLFDKADKAAPSSDSNTAFGGVTSTGSSYASSSHRIYNGVGYGFISVCGGCFPLCCCFGLGSLLIAIYAGMFAVIANQDYYGPMLVTSYDFHESESKKDDKRFEYWYSTSVVTTYGYDWACPDQGNKVCTNVDAEIEDCAQLICTSTKTKTGCSVEEYGQAKEKGASCLAKEIFFQDNITTSDELNKFISSFSFDPSIYPLDVNTTTTTQPPIAYLYGDCDKCSARASIPDAEAALELKDTGGFFMLIGLILVCCGMCCSAGFKPQRPPPKSNNGGNTSSAVPSNSDTAHYATPYGGDTSTPAENTNSTSSYARTNNHTTESSGPTGGFADALGPSPSMSF